MVKCSNGNDELLQIIKDMGLNISNEDFEKFTQELNEKYNVQKEISQKHPITRTFENIRNAKKNLILT